MTLLQLVSRNTTNMLYGGVVPSVIDVPCPHPGYGIGTVQIARFTFVSNTPRRKSLRFTPEW
eukprot:1748647-Amphidinium_carterae.1